MEPITAQVIKENTPTTLELFFQAVDRLVMYFIVCFTVYFGFICLEMMKVQQADNHKIAMNSLRHTKSIQYPYYI